jgi:hypothetical protein
MSRGVVGCDRSKLWAMLTDEGGRQRSSGGNRRSPVVGIRRGELVGASEWCEGESGTEMAEQRAATAAVPF